MALINQGTIQKLNENVGSSGGNPGRTFDDIKDIINTALGSYILPTAFFLVMLYGILGAIQYFTAYGVEEKATKGKKMMTYAIVGAIIVASAWLIVRYVGHFINANEAVDNALKETNP